MPIEKHPSFNEPPEDTKLWRYMELSKFVSLVTTSGLWFSSAEALAADDPFEGSLPTKNLGPLNRDDIPDYYWLNLTRGLSPEEAETAPDYLSEAVNAVCKMTGLARPIKRSTLLDLPPLPPGRMFSIDIPLSDIIKPD